MAIERSRLTETVEAAFTEHGLNEGDAAATADVLVTAEARGKQSHGLIRVPRYIRGIEHGNVDPEGTIEVVRDAGAATTLDGGSRIGPAVALEASATAVERADTYGIGAVGVHNSTHLGMLGYYTDVIRKAGYVALAMTNTEPAMAPHGAREAVLGTNPIAIGLPTEPPFNLDMSTSSVARGTLERAAERGESIPADVALGPDGEPTTDPRAALEGTIRPFGGPKGSGLALAVEILAGGLVGASMGDAVTGTYHTTEPCTKGDLFVVLDPEAMGGETVLEETNAFLRRVTDLEPAGDHEQVRLPGQKAISEEREMLSVDEESWQTVCSLAGVDSTM